MTMTDTREDKLANAREQGQAQFDSILEMVTELQAADTARAAAYGRDDERRWEAAEQAILEDPLSIEVRGDWYAPHDCEMAARERAAEYRILLCTGGPACRIRGQLSEHGEPETAHLEVQDWFTPWTEHMQGLGPNAEEILLAYARCFWFGE